MLNPLPAYRNCHFLLVWKRETRDEEEITSFSLDFPSVKDSSWNRVDESLLMIHQLDAAPSTSTILVFGHYPC